MLEHKLASRKQQPSESTDQFLQTPKLLSEDYGFKAVSASVYAVESIRDAFISGLSSSTISQGLQEKHTLTLDEEVKHAGIIELAQQRVTCRSPSSYPGHPLGCFGHRITCTRLLC